MSRCDSTPYLNQSAVPSDYDQDAAFHLSALKVALQDLRLALEFPNAAAKIEYCLPTFIANTHKVTEVCIRVTEHIRQLQTIEPRKGRTNAEARRLGHVADMVSAARCLDSVIPKIGTRQTTQREQAAERRENEIKTLVAELAQLDARPLLEKYGKKLRLQLELKIIRLKARHAKLAEKTLTQHYIHSKADEAFAEGKKPDGCGTREN